MTARTESPEWKAAQKSMSKKRTQDWSRLIDCPVCKQPTGSPCLSMSSKGTRCSDGVRATAHLARLRLATAKKVDHWDTKCLTVTNGKQCGHRKGNHAITAVRGAAVAIDHCGVYLCTDHGLTGAKHLCSSVKAPCQCPGFSDGVYWKDGKRIL